MSSDLDKLRRTAKLLKKAYARGDAAALRRLKSVVPALKEPLHADFLHVIAVEEGHESWPKLKLALETAGMTRADRAKRLQAALYHGQAWVIEKLLAADPGLAHFDLAIELALCDLEAVEARITADPSLATTEIHGRTPLVHLCFSKYHKCGDVAPDRILAIAEVLRQNGADPNESYPEPDGSGHRVSVLYGALGHADNMPLAEWLLGHGAYPDDNESLYHSVELDHLDGLRLLCRYGVSPSGTNALHRALDFDRIEAVRILLEHGADPNEGIEHHPGGQPPLTFTSLHQAARRGRSGLFAEVLLDFGADASGLWHGLSAYEMACLYGNADFARVLAAKGHATSLAPAVAVLAECAGGGTPSTSVRGMELSDEVRRLAIDIAGRPGELPYLKALMAAGLDPAITNEMGMTALQAAAWAGLADQVAFLLSLDPDLSHRNRYGGDVMGTVIHGAEFAPQTAGAKHVTCARLLLEAGAVFPQGAADGTGNEEMAAFLSEWREDHSAAPVSS